MISRFAPRRVAAISCLAIGAALFAAPGQAFAADAEPDADMASIRVTKDDRGATVAEPEGTVTYFVTVENTGSVGVTLIRAEDIIVTGGNLAIDITRQGGVVYDTTCHHLVGTALAPGQSYNCRFTIPFRGNAGDVKIDRLTVWAGYVPYDDEEIDEEIDSTNNQYVVSGTDTEETPMTDVKPTMVVDKSDNNATATAPGSNVVYTVNVTNTSVEPITITEVWDNINNTWYDLSKVAHPVVATTCNTLINKVLPVNGSAGCTFTFFVAGNAGSSVTDGVKVVARDDEGNEIRIWDHETTPIVAPAPTTTQAPTTQAPTTQAPATTAQAPATTAAAPATTEAPAPSSSEPEVAVLGTSVSLAVTGRESANRAAAGSMIVGLGLLCFAVEKVARRRRAERAL